MAKILLHSLVFPPDANSNAYIFADLAKELRALGHDVTVLTTTPHYNRVQRDIDRQPMTPLGPWLLRSEYEGIPCYHVRVAPEKGGMAMRIMTALRFHLLGTAAALRRRFACDVVVSQSPPLSIGMSSALIARRHGARSIYVAQDIFPDGLIHQGRIRNPLAIRFLRWLERRVYAASDAVVSISAGLVETLRPRVPARTLLRTIPNFVDTRMYRPLPRQNSFAREHGLEGVFVVSYLGNLGNAQNFTPVMKAADALRDEPVKFLLVGGGIKYGALVQEARDRRLSNLEILEYQPRESTPLINAASDLCLVLLSPHVRNFSFPSKVYTLMACGRPILLYGNPDADVARFVLEARVGWVVPDGDLDGFRETVKRLARDPSALAEAGKRGVGAVAEGFNSQSVARLYDALFQELLNDECR